MINDFNSAEIKIFSITEINKLVKELLQDNFPTIWVKGEISNFIEASSGHWYFSLIDNNAQVRCTMFRGKNNNVKCIKLVINPRFMTDFGEPEKAFNNKKW